MNPLRMMRTAWNFYARWARKVPLFASYVKAHRDFWVILGVILAPSRSMTRLACLTGNE